MSAAEIVTAAGVAFGSVGGGVAFIWNKIEKRFGQIENQLDACEGRERADLKRRAVQLTVIELLWQEVTRFAPGNPVLVRAKKLLDDLKDQNDEARR